MFHVNDDLYFRRNEDGSVTILKTSDGREPNDAAPEDSNVAFAQTLDDGSWCSVVLSMSAFSERPGDWHAWMRHHKGEEDLLVGKRGPKEDEMATQWNGEPCEARRVVVRVAHAAKPTYWYADLEGKEINAVEVRVGNEVFYIDDRDGNGWHKVTVEGGGPHWGHASIDITNVVRERHASDLCEHDCHCAA